MPQLITFVYISLFLITVKRDHIWCSALRNLEEVRCEPGPNCMCMNFDLNSRNFFLEEPYYRNVSKLVCEKEIKVNLTTMSDSSSDHSAILEVLCDLDASSDNLLKDYYSLLKWKHVSYQYIFFEVSSCPPIFYMIFLFPRESPAQIDKVSAEWISLNIDCEDYSRKFPLQRKHLNGIQILKKITIRCFQMTDLPSDIFYDSPFLSEIKIESTKVSSVSANTFSNQLELRELWIDNNSLSNISDGTFNNLKSLQILDLSHNYLASLADNIFKDLHELEHLNLSNNNLISLPRSIANLTNLETLDVSYNSLVDIYPIESLSRLVHLNAEVDKLIDLKVLELKKIKAILFSGNVVTKLDNIPPIRVIDFGENKLISIPEDLFLESQQLYKVILRKNNILYLLPNTFSSNPILKEVDISSNRINRLPDELFAKNHELRYLDISKNQLTTLSSALFHNTSSLQVLYASDNQLTTIDSSLFRSSRSISRLDLSGNLIIQIPKDVFSPIIEELFHLNLARNSISSLSPLSLPYVQYLNLSHNYLEHIPEGIFQSLSVLISLDLSFNRIKNISNSPLLPPNVQMTLLDLSNNQLSHIPLQLFAGNGILIESINFSYNAFTDFNACIVLEVQKLSELRISNNKLLYFGIRSSCFFSLYYGRVSVEIRVLDLSNNSLDFKDADFFYDDTRSMWGRIAFPGGFPNLEVLFLSNNSISTICLDWRVDLPKLRILDLRNNKITHLQHQDLVFPSPSEDYSFVHDATYHQITAKTINTPRSSLPSLIVDLRGNIIKSVNIPLNKVEKIYLERNGRIPAGIYGHATILLDDNPFLCDCSMLNFLRIVQNDVAPITGNDRTLPARIEVGNLSCWEPKSIRGSLISEPETWIHHLIPLIALCSSQGN